MRIERIDVGLATVGTGSPGDGKCLDTRHGVAEASRLTKAHAVDLLLLPDRDPGDTLHGLDLGANLPCSQIADGCLRRAGILHGRGDLSRVKAFGIACFFEPLLRALGIIGIRLKGRATSNSFRMIEPIPGAAP